MHSVSFQSSQASKNPWIIAQISDCHLFSDPFGLHHGANVYQHLIAVLSEIKSNPHVQLIIFTGDLTQDHQAMSYQLFAQAVTTVNIDIPLYFLSGNHDEPELLNRYLIKAPFCSAKLIESEHWQLLLVESKSKEIDGPSGQVDETELVTIEQVADDEKFQLIFTHHHPVEVGYFIDKHGLKNADQFWQVIGSIPSITAIACGHVHRAMTLLPAETARCVPVFTCPATSIQFDPSCPTVSALNQGPGYRLFTLHYNGNIDTSVHYINGE